MKTATLRPGFWNREHHLDKMTFRELVIAYFQYPAIIAYLALRAVSIGRLRLAAGAARCRPCSRSARRPRLPVLLVPHPPLHPAQPLDVASTNGWPSTWKRIHYDHHQDPNHLEVLFGALHTTLPTIALGVIPIG